MGDISRFGKNRTFEKVGPTFAVTSWPIFIGILMFTVVAMLRPTFVAIFRLRLELYWGHLIIQNIQEFGKNGTFENSGKN